MTADDDGIDVHIPTPDPQPPVVEHSEDNGADIIHNRLTRLESRVDGLVASVETGVTHDHLENRLHDYARADHNHDDRYLTLQRYEDETEPVTPKEDSEMVTATLSAPVETVEDALDASADQGRKEEEDYSKLGLRF